MNEEKGKITNRHKKAVGVIAFLTFLLFCGLVGWYIGKPMLALLKEPETFRRWVASHGFFGYLIFIGMTVIQVIVALIPGEPLEIGAGYAFGAFMGSILSLIGTVLGGLIVFLLVRRFGIKLVEVFFPIEKIRNLKILRNEKRLNVIMFFAFFLPGTPKDLLTYAVGLTDIPLKSFLILTSIARLPSIITSTVAGNALGKERYLFAVIVFAITLGASLIGLWVYNKHCTEAPEKTTEEREQDAEKC